MLEAVLLRRKPRNDRERVVQSLARAGAAATWWYLLVFRPWHLRWGATEAEVRRVMPGDEVVPSPYLEATRAVTIDAPPSAIWPWLVQMGYHRAGWYAYDLLDKDGLPSENRIVPELQEIAVGDILPTGPEGGFRVEAVEPERSLVLAIQEWRVLLSASYLLVPIDETRTRLVHRLRARFGMRNPWYLYYLLFEPGDFIMVRKMLLGIKDRAERLWQRSQPCHDVVAASNPNDSPKLAVPGRQPSGARAA